MNYWEIVWGALGGATVALAVVAFLSKTLVAHFFAKDLENYKSVLKAEHDKELEELKFENTKDVERIRVQLAEGKAERDARRDYEYEARKRLYQEYEPLLFQLIELSENALYRIYSLARVARVGDLKPGRGWMSSIHSYYLISTVYNLMVPMAVFRIIQRRLTMVDLRVDPNINMQYLLTKYLYYSFAEHHELALEYEPILEYDPNCEDWERKRQEQPEKYWRQGLAIGRLDNAVESLLVRESMGIWRSMSFGEFESGYFKEGSAVHSSFDVVVDLFFDFHPKTRPVLWRILVIQAHIYQGILHALAIRDPQVAENYKPLEMLQEVDRQKLDWRQPREDVTDDEVLVQPFHIAKMFLLEKLGPLFNQGPGLDTAAPSQTA
jgi:hypothetical protein